MAKLGVVQWECGIQSQVLEGPSSNLWDLLWEGPEGHLYMAPGRQRSRASWFLMLRQNTTLHLKKG